MSDHNMFEKPEAIAPSEFKGARAAAGIITATIPAKSVVVLEVK